jgi:hypothetical protein
MVVLLRVRLAKRQRNKRLHERKESVNEREFIRMREKLQRAEQQRIWDLGKGE